MSKKNRKNKQNEQNEGTEMNNPFEALHALGNNEEVQQPEAQEEQAEVVAVEEIHSEEERPAADDTADMPKEEVQEAPAPAPKVTAAKPAKSAAQGDAIDNMRIKNALAEIRRYAEDMAPRKPQDPVKGAKRQVELYGNIMEIMKNGTYNEFKAGMAELRKIWTEPAFGDRYINRFSEGWTLSHEKLLNMRNIANFLALVANDETRAKLKQHLDIEAFLGSFVDMPDSSNIAKYVAEITK